jgi:pimeloyl-ACP methyl ester carboxylesterase
MWGRDAHGNTKLKPLAGFELIAFDCRGHGKSDKPHEQSKYGAEMAEDVVRLLDHLHIEKAHLLGYSMGAFIAGKVAATHPDRVLSLIYADQAPLIIGTQSGGSDECEIFAKAVDDGKGLGPYLLAVAPTGMKLTLDQANSMTKSMFYGKDVKAFALSGLSLGDLRVTAADLRKCKAPTLFIYGGDESHYVTDDITVARSAIGISEVKIVDGADHMTTLVKPEFASTIEEFLRAHKAK